LIFGTVSGNSVYIPIWAEGIANLNAAGKTIGTQSKGQWVSVTGMVDADFATGSWSRTGITVVDASHINFISEAEAKRRLTSKTVTSATSFTPSTPAQTTALNSAARNAQIAAQAKAAASKSSPSSSTYKKSPAPRKSPARSSYSSTPSRSSSYSPSPKSSGGGLSTGAWIAIGIGVLILISLFNGG
jgi:cobalamin biosynthesis Mg chelatase CobN